MRGIMDALSPLPKGFVESIMFYAWEAGRKNE
jgi:hypothetical protein